MIWLTLNNSKFTHREKPSTNQISRGLHGGVEALPLKSTNLGGDYF